MLVSLPKVNLPDRKQTLNLKRMARFDLAERLHVIANQFENLAVVTRFTLADQVLTRALVESGLRLPVISGIDEAANSREIESLVQITRETYGLKFEDADAAAAVVITTGSGSVSSKSGFVSRNAKQARIEINPVADWSEEELVAYVLDHEVPVNPKDMPGFTKRVA